MAVVFISSMALFQSSAMDTAFIAFAETLGEPIVYNSHDSHDTSAQTIVMTVASCMSTLLLSFGFWTCVLCMEVFPCVRALGA